MNPFVLIGIVILVFVVALLAGFLIGWELANRRAAKQVQQLRSEMVLSMAAQVAQKLRVGDPGPDQENSKPGPGVVQAAFPPDPVEDALPTIPRPVGHGHPPGPGGINKAPRKHGGDRDSAQ